MSLWDTLYNLRLRIIVASLIGLGIMATLIIIREYRSTGVREIELVSSGASHRGDTLINK